LEVTNGSAAYIGSLNDVNVEEELGAICGWQTTSPVPADLVSDSEAFTTIRDAKLVVIVVEICGVSLPGMLFAFGLIVFDAEAVGPGAP
jgi:hypothetical protein